MAEIRLPKGMLPPVSLLAQPVLPKSTQEINAWKEANYKRYQECSQQFNKELSLFMPLEIDWACYACDHTPFSLHSAESTVWLNDLVTAYTLYPQVQKHLASSFAVQSLSALELLAHGAYQQAYVLYIPQGITPLKPIVLEYSQETVSLSISSLFIIVESGVSVTLVNRHRNTCGVAFTAIQAFIEPYASIKMVTELTVGETGYSFDQEVWRIADHASITQHEVITGGATLKAKQYYLNGISSQVTYTQCTALKELERSALIVQQQHQEKNTVSKVQAKSVLCGKASSFYQGAIAIKEQATGSQAEQYQTALMVSPESRACAIPSLEIQTNEVYCKHGSAAGKINENYLWYLTSRGLDYIQAQRLIIEGFLSANIEDTVEVKENIVARLFDSGG